MHMHTELVFFLAMENSSISLCSCLFILCWNLKWVNSVSQVIVYIFVLFCFSCLFSRTKQKWPCSWDQLVNCSSSWRQSIMQLWELDFSWKRISQQSFLGDGCAKCQVLQSLCFWWWAWPGVARAVLPPVLGVLFLLCNFEMWVSAFESSCFLLSPSNLKIACHPTLIPKKQRYFLWILSMLFLFISLVC